MFQIVFPASSMARGQSISRHDNDLSLSMIRWRVGLLSGCSFQEGVNLDEVNIPRTNLQGGQQ